MNLCIGDFVKVVGDVYNEGCIGTLHEILKVEGEYFYEVDFEENRARVTYSGKDLRRVGVEEVAKQEVKENTVKFHIGDRVKLVVLGHMLTGTIGTIQSKQYWGYEVLFDDGSQFVFTALELEAVSEGAREKALRQSRQVRDQLCEAKDKRRKINDKIAELEEKVKEYDRYLRTVDSLTEQEKELGL